MGSFGEHFQIKICPGTKTAVDGTGKKTVPSTFTPVYMNVSMNAKNEKLYPEINVGDKVKIARKKAITEKERTSHFLKGEFIVEQINSKLGQNITLLVTINRH